MLEQVVTIRARAFDEEGIRAHRCTVDADGSVRVWDDVAKHYTLCHFLSEGAQQLARNKAVKQGLSLRSQK